MQAHIIISGYVHSVGFRRFIKDLADKGNVKGFVRNTTDRQVETLLQGEKDKLEEIIKLCHKGPMMAEVKGVSIDWQDVSDPYVDFEILPTLNTL